MSAVIREGAAVAASLPTRERRSQPLRACVQSALEIYFKDLDGHDAEGIYDMVIGQVEQAMLESVMQQVRSNQTRAAEVLGINRSTLRKKLKLYGLL
ncbi:Fis family transcriptional regulator [Thiogranum longum]|uniref:Putative Fis-like DNA-binding protein n=1 Tax=Thiogranum longum TaxID=1537524 RepID=A0A4R1HBL1_9GAMM|nr:DNA-binding transcriptional regulator Fis [Thiogranum longum]TCK19374.1 Fis family transcriptional regulator [Thiogranum longum]